MQSLSLGVAEVRGVWGFGGRGLRSRNDRYNWLRFDVALDMEALRNFWPCFISSDKPWGTRPAPVATATARRLLGKGITKDGKVSPAAWKGLAPSDYKPLEGTFAAMKVYSHNGPIRRRKRGYILTTVQSEYLSLLFRYAFVWLFGTATIVVTVTVTVTVWSSRWKASALQS
eukprot:8966530-Pyramimonas_sp.AAC.1